MHKIFFESIRGPVTCLGVTGTTSIHTAMRTQDAAIRHEIGVTSPQSQTKRQTPNAARKNKCLSLRPLPLERLPFAYCPARACFLHLGDLGSCATGLGLGRNCANKTVCVCHWVEGPGLTHCRLGDGHTVKSSSSRFQLEPDLPTAQLEPDLPTAQLTPQLGEQRLEAVA